MRLIKVSKDWCRQNAPYASIRDLCVVSVTGDSMSPKIEGGDFVLVDLSQKNRSDGIHLLRISGALDVKRIQRFPDGIRIICDNPSYRSYDLTGDKAATAQVLGRAVAVANLRQL